MSAEGELVRVKVAKAYTASFRPYIKAMRKTEAYVKVTASYARAAGRAGRLTAFFCQEACADGMADIERIKTDKERGMRIMGFSEMWSKLQQPEFTTFRVPRKDKDWYVPEIVQVVYRPRGKNRKPICLAEIYRKEPTTFKAITEAEAIADGFANTFRMWVWLNDAHKGITMDSRINKLYLSKLPLSG